MSKTIIIIIIIIIIAGLGYWVYQSRGPAEEIKDGISVFLDNLKKETGIKFSAIQPSQFKWVIEIAPTVEEVNIQGKSFAVEGISIEQEERVVEFLKNKGFLEDIYNITAGTVSGSMGYKKDEVVCVIILGKGDVDVKCGKLISSTESLISAEEACIGSGGLITTSLCCKATSDYPNLCLIGPCGCSPNNSHQVKICECGPDKCFNGKECLLRE